MSHKDLKKKWMNLLESRKMAEMDTYHGYDELPDNQYTGYDDIEGGGGSDGDSSFGSSLDLGGEDEMLESDPVAQGRKDWKKVMETQMAYKLLQETNKLALMFDKVTERLHLIDTVKEFEDLMADVINLDRAFEQEFGDKVTFGNHFVNKWTVILRLIKQFASEADPELIQALQPVLKRNGTGGIETQVAKAREWSASKEKERMAKERKFVIEVGRQIANHFDSQIRNYTLEMIEEEDLFDRFLKGIVRGLKSGPSGNYKTPISQDQLELPITSQDDIGTISEIGEILGELLSKMDKDGRLTDDFQEALKFYMRKFKDSGTGKKAILKDISSGASQSIDAISDDDTQTIG